MKSATRPGASEPEGLGTSGALARHTTAERLADTLSHMILNGSLPPGAPLREEELTKSHSVSRHVVREALRLVASAGLATYEAYKGARVSYVSVEDVRDIFQTRRFIELAAVRAFAVDSLKKLAATQSSFSTAVQAGDWVKAFQFDIEFHGTIVAASGSRRLLAWHAELFQPLTRAHLVRPEFREEGLRASVPQHAEIIVALAASDADAACTALCRHLDYSEDLLIGCMHDR